MDLRSLWEAMQAALPLVQQGGQQVQETIEGRPDPNVLGSDPLGGAPMSAIVPTAKNLKMFLAAIGGNTKYDTIKSADYNNVLGYMRTRYPRLFSKVKGVSYFADKDFPREFLNADYNPATSKIGIYDVPGQYKAKDYVNALSHELGHVAQARKRTGAEFQTDYERAGPYKTNTFEQEARKAGQTGISAYERFLALVKKELGLEY